MCVSIGENLLLRNCWTFFFSMKFNRICNWAASVICPFVPPPPPLWAYPWSKNFNLRNRWMDFLRLKFSIIILTCSCAVSGSFAPPPPPSGYWRTLIICFFRYWVLEHIAFMCSEARSLRAAIEGLSAHSTTTRNHGQVWDIASLWYYTIG